MNRGLAYFVGEILKTYCVIAIEILRFTWNSRKTFLSYALLARSKYELIEPLLVVLTCYCVATVHKVILTLNHVFVFLPSALQLIVYEESNEIVFCFL